MTMKPLKGVIANWSLDGDRRIRGTCVLHTTYQNGIERDQQITTSEVVGIVRQRDGALICETKNSLYVLI